MPFDALPALLPLAQYDPFINPFAGDIKSADSALRSFPTWQVIGVKWVVSAVLLFVFSRVTGKRIHFRGPVALLTAALIVAPGFLLVGPVMDLLNLSGRSALSQLVLAMATATVIYAVLIVAASYLVPDVKVDQIAVAVFVAALMAVSSWGLSLVLGIPGLGLSLAPLLAAPRPSRRPSRPSTEAP